MFPFSGFGGCLNQSGLFKEFTEREGRVVDEDNDAISDDATFTIVSSNFTSRVECNPAPKS
jgi:hypothetical protein